MKFYFNLTITPKGIAITGVGVLLLLIALFSLPNLLAESLEPGRAEQWIRSYLKKGAGIQHREALAATGKNVPDRAMAEQWQADYQRIDQTEFLSVEVKHFLVAPPGASSRIFVARVVLKEPDADPQTRYFSLSAENNLFDFFWVNEHGRLMWTFAF